MYSQTVHRSVVTVEFEDRHQESGVNLLSVFVFPYAERAVDTRADDRCRREELGSLDGCSVALSGCDDLRRRVPYSEVAVVTPGENSLRTTAKLLSGPLGSFRGL